MITANSFVPGPAVFFLAGDPCEALLDHWTTLGPSEERWFAYSLRQGGCANAIVFGLEGSPTMDGRTADRLWAEVGAFLQRFHLHRAALKALRSRDGLRTIWKVYLQLSRFLQGLLRLQRFPPRAAP